MQAPKAPEVIQARHHLDEHLLTPQFIKSCTEKLISRFMISGKDELQAWEEEPESLLVEEEADHWEYNLRVSDLPSISLFIIFFKIFFWVNRFFFSFSIFFFPFFVLCR